MNNLGEFALTKKLSISSTGISLKKAGFFYSATITVIFLAGCAKFLRHSHSIPYQAISAVCIYIYQNLLPSYM